MSTYILSENNLSCQELERKLKLLNTLIKAFLREPEDLEKYGDLIKERLKIERELNILFYPEIEALEECVSPNWEEVGVLSQDNKTTKQDLELELSVLRKQREVKKPRRRKHNSNLSILNVLDMAGVVVKRGFILCPFHEERNPSCKIYPASDTFYCFGCGKWGTAYDLAKALGVQA